MCIIAIGGLANAGKDTVAEMTEYLLNSPKIFRSYFWFNRLKGRFKKPYNTTSFAKKLKETLAVMLSMDEEDFNNRWVKEHVFIDFNTFKKYELVDTENPPSYMPPVLPDNKFAKAVANNDFSFVSTHVLTIRQIMQMFGTNIVRRVFNDKFWVYRTLGEDNIIISDLRFKVEMDELKNQKATTIYIDRPGILPGNHPSEKEVVEMKDQFDFTIINDGSMKDLFDKVKDLCQLIKS